MGKKRSVQILAMLLALAMLLTMVTAVTAHALEKTCRVRVQSGVVDSDVSLEETGAVADLYLLASSPAEGLYDYPGLDPNIDQDGWRALAEKEAAARVGVSAPEISGLELGVWADANSDGSKIVPGLYLLIVRPAEGSDYLKTFQDDEGDNYLASEITAKSHSIRVAPEIIALPGKISEDGPANSGDTSPWVYDMDISVKPGIEKRLGSIEIVKDLLSHEKDHDAFFLFQVEGYLNNEHVYSNLVSIRFDTYGEKSVVLDNIPVGTEITVKETYATPGYKLVSTAPADGKLIVSADEILSVRFENDYSGTRDKGGGIMNSFDYDLERGEWSWIQE